MVASRRTTFSQAGLSACRSFSTKVWRGDVMSGQGSHQLQAALRGSPNHPPMAHVFAVQATYNRAFMHVSGSTFGSVARMREQIRNLRRSNSPVSRANDATRRCITSLLAILSISRSIRLEGCDDVTMLLDVGRATWELRKYWHGTDLHHTALFTESSLT